MRTIRRYTQATPARLVEHILEHPHLVAAVRELEPAVLGRLVDSIGLESAGDIVALATTEQLQHVFDEDLWRSDRAGQEPELDAARFATWLEVMFEAGEQAVVERLCELPLELMSLAVHRLVLVLDLDALQTRVTQGGEDPDWIDKALDSCLSEQWEELLLISRDASAWDVVLSALMALDRDHHDRLRSILEQCCYMSTELIEDNGGLYDVLTADEMLESDTRALRDERRIARGHVAESDARSFLELARLGEAPSDARDPVTRAYFRELRAAQQETTGQDAATKTGRAADRSGDVSSLMDVLAEAEVVDSMATKLPELEPATTADNPVSSSAPQGSESLRSMLRMLHESDPELYAERMEELGFLANVLIAGLSTRQRRIRPLEAIEAAVAVIDLGMKERAKSANRGSTKSHSLDEPIHVVPLDCLFRRGWHRSFGGRRDAVTWDDVMTFLHRQ